MRQSQHVQIPEASLLSRDWFESQFFEYAARGDIYRVDAGEHLSEPWLSACMRDRRACHLSGVTLPGEALEHCVYQLRLRMNRWKFQESAEADQCFGMIRDQPKPDAPPPEQNLAVANPLLAPLPREQIAVQKIAANMRILYQTVEGIEIIEVHR